jgi:hypothetical protein
VPFKKDQIIICQIVKEVEDGYAIRTVTVHTNRSGLLITQNRYVPSALLVAHFVRMERSEIILVDRTKSDRQKSFQLNCRILKPEPHGYLVLIDECSQQLAFLRTNQSHRNGDEILVQYEYTNSDMIPVLVDLLRP